MKANTKAGTALVHVPNGGARAEFPSAYLPEGEYKQRPRPEQVAPDMEVIGHWMFDGELPNLGRIRIEIWAKDVSDAGAMMVAGGQKVMGDLAKEWKQSRSFGDTKRDPDFAPVPGAEHNGKV